MDQISQRYPHKKFRNTKIISQKIFFISIFKRIKQCKEYTRNNACYCGN